MWRSKTRKGCLNMNNSYKHAMRCTARGTGPLFCSGYRAPLGTGRTASTV